MILIGRNANETRSVLCKVNATFAEFSGCWGAQKEMESLAATLEAIFTPNFRQFFIAIAKVFTNYLKRPSPQGKNFACNLTNHCKGYTFHSLRSCCWGKVPRKYPFLRVWLRKKGPFFGPAFQYFPAVCISKCANKCIQNVCHCSLVFIFALLSVAYFSAP